MRKILDQNGRLFGLISLIDVLVIAVVIVLAVALNVKSKIPTSATNPANTTTITFQAMAEAVPDYVAQAIQVGDKVYDKDQSTGGAIGEITSVELFPASKNEELSNGTAATVAAEERYNVLVTVQGSGLVENGRYAVNRIYEVGVNASRNLYTKYALFKASMIAVW